MRQHWSRLVPVLAVLLGATAVQAQPGPPPQGSQGQGFERRGPHGAPLQKLELSEEQQAQVRAIMGDQRPQLQTLHQKMSANRDALHQLLETGSADANAVGELVLEGRTLQEQSRAIREASQKTIRGILTPEQQEKFDQMEQRRRDGGTRGQGHKGKGKGKRGGQGAPGAPRSPSPGGGAPPR